MKYLASPHSIIELTNLLDSTLKDFLEIEYQKAKKVIVVDENTHEFCLEYLITNFDSLTNAEVILLPAGEENKVMEVCFQVWEALSEYKISRNDLIINLGGGVVTDMGGFIASVYKRGVTFLNIPTTLLAMVDASVGGKTGVDLGQYKNQLGVFAFPSRVYIDTVFLSTLPKEELLNGYAEMLKHGLIADSSHWNKLKASSIDELDASLILDSITIKNEIVLSDPYENNERKKLNFGHTFGHAFEGYLLGSDDQIAHGYAVALGIVCESYLSFKKGLLNEIEFFEILSVIQTNFKLIAFQEDDFKSIHELMLNDKKNSFRIIKVVLLKGIGSCVVDQLIEEEDVYDALGFLLKLVLNKEGK